MGYGTLSYFQRAEADRLELERLEKLAVEERRLEELALRPQEEFQHPYDSLPWYKRLFKAVGRFLYLSYLFVPCTAVGMVSALSNDVSWRKYFIDYLVRTLEAAGSTFQKYGQWISNRPDIFAPDVIEAMKGLCSDAPVHSAEATREEIRRSLGVDVEEIFEEFDWEPVASGTVAQVHRAKLKPEHALKNGRVDVAVKVRHPGVMDETFVDAGFLFSLVNGASKFSRSFCVPFEEEEFTTMVQKQINLKWEAYNICKFRNNFRACRDDHRNGDGDGDDTAVAGSGRGGDFVNNRGSGGHAHADQSPSSPSSSSSSSSLKESGIGMNNVQFPSVHVEHVSNSVLIEEWVEGTSVQAFFEEVGEGFQRTARVAVDVAVDVVASAAENVAAVVVPKAAVQKAAELTTETKHRIASAVLHSAFTMFFRDNLVHGDMHGGNVMYDERTGRVTLIDAGITTQLGNKETTDDFLCFLHGMSQGNAEILTDSLLRLLSLIHI